MTIKLLTEHHLEFLRLEEAAEARLSIHLSKCHIVGNHVSQLIYKCTLLTGCGNVSTNQMGFLPQINEETMFIERVVNKLTNLPCPLEQR